MNNFIITIATFLIAVLAISAAEPEQRQISKKEHFKRYLVGIKYLEAANNFSREEKVAYYNKLVEITGFTAEKANDYAKRYENTPEKWLQLIESVVEMINKPPEKEEKE